MYYYLKCCGAELAIKEEKTKKLSSRKRKEKNDCLVKEIDECIIYYQKCCGAELAIKEEKTKKLSSRKRKEKNDCLVKEIDECVIICS